ncbi:MAG: uracil-DNA glycosylase family protein [Bacteroidia bacterium]|nr:uracil-DNA glycosylase family protein [Bacteroidia bacterium]MBT8309867.1 uracil-DNA glycosylase family protein [Bacteroidia bacterium]NNK27187.1 uracil-DNA glycosylase family protein [Flavobacteriaceae bacterium]NNL60886.1 uracil-DNA glycosylase family protein [Flavobacteriaceae bacterium]RZV59166.1 MAG: uracil-DNA glycosylase family protein [Flavobacteriaceae bacterium]
MFLHRHPYRPFIMDDTRRLIVGTLPPPRFTTGELLEKDVDFCYGSYYNSLWLYIDRIHDLGLRYDNSQEAIDQRKSFLITHQIGVCDIVESAQREKIDASDLGMKNIELRDLVGYLRKYPSIETLLFIGGNSMNGPEYFFRRHLKQYNNSLELINGNTPRIHQFLLDGSRIIKTVSLTSSSGAANRSIGSNKEYQRLKNENPRFSTFDFRVRQYREFI